MFSETRYAYSGETAIAYRTTSSGPRDILFVSNWFANVDVVADISSHREFNTHFAKLGRLIIYDQAGTGASDPISLDALPTLEQWTDTLTTIMEAAGSREAVLLGFDSGFCTAALFAATHPDRASALIGLGGYPRKAWAQDYPFGVPIDTWTTGVNATASIWGTGAFQRMINPDMPWSEEIRAEWAKLERLAAPPGVFKRMAHLVSALDVRDILPAVRVPTLILSHSEDPMVPPEIGRDIAARIPQAKFVEIPGRNHYLTVEPGWRAAFEEITEFLTGTRASEVVDDRMLATVLFTDIVDSTRKAAELGDGAWRSLLDAHDATVRAQLSRFRGREIDIAGDSFLATFDGPQRAIRCAIAIRDAVRPLGIELRAGLHTGECEKRGDRIGGIAVHIGARVSALAGASEILVSGTLRDLVVGSDLVFEDRGSRELKGVPGEWRIYAVSG